ncbi:MAG: restriction endonuclease subunit S (plasmid) [Candidatus Methanoperedens sp.]|nr:MAG: restriction endonuclease subunit S [Candidatus Methanoperedens sp.]
MSTEYAVKIKSPSADILPKGWLKVPFEYMAENISVHIEPDETDLNIYVGLEHLDSDSLRIKRWGTPDDVIGIKLHVWPGDIIFGKRRAYQRKVAVADFEAICSAHSMVLRARPENIVQEFLPFFMQSEEFAQRAVAISEGSLSPTIKWKNLAHQKFIIPPKDEQRRIADILWAAEDYIVKSEKLVEKAEIYNNTLMMKLFTKGIGHRDFKDTEIGKIPITWEIGTISTIAEVNPKTDVSQLHEDSPVTFLPMENISENAKILKRDTRKYFEVKKGFTCFAERDVLFAKITPCMENGKGALATYLTNNIGFGSTEYHVLRAKENGNAEFILFLTRSQKIRKDAEKYMTGSAGQKRVSKDLFLHYKIPIPPLNEQRQIANILSKVDDTIQKAQENINKIKTVKMMLINQFLKNGLENTANPQQGKKIIYETKVSE